MRPQAWESLLSKLSVPRGRPGRPSWIAVAVAALVLVVASFVLLQSLLLVAHVGGRRVHLLEPFVEGNRKLLVSIPMDELGLGPRKGQGRDARALVYNTLWGHLALGELRGWRSTLFYRLARLYTEEERQQTVGGQLWWMNMRLEPEGRGRYNMADAITSCPFGELRRARDGNWLCMEGLLNRSGCLIYSMGGDGSLGFERAMMEATECEVHTFDCLHNSQSLDLELRHFVHKVCLGASSHVEGSGSGSLLVFWDYPTILMQLGHAINSVALMHLDMDGFEYDAISGLSEQLGCYLPAQISMHLRYSELYLSKQRSRDVNPMADFRNLFWAMHEVTMGEISTFFWHLANLGYAIVSRRDGDGEGCCPEFTLIKIEQPADCVALTFPPSPQDLPPPPPPLLSPPARQDQFPSSQDGSQTLLPLELGWHQPPPQQLKRAAEDVSLGSTMQASGLRPLSPQTPIQQAATIQAPSLQPRSTQMPARQAATTQTASLQATSRQTPVQQVDEPQAYILEVLSREKPRQQAAVTQALSLQAASGQTPVRRAAVTQVPSRHAASGQMPVQQAAVIQAPSQHAASGDTPARQAADTQAPSHHAASGDTPARQAADTQAPTLQAATRQTPAPKAATVSTALPHKTRLLPKRGGAPGGKQGRRVSPSKLGRQGRKSRSPAAGAGPLNRTSTEQSQPQA